MFNLFMTILKRDLTLSLRRKSDLAQVIFFFAVVVTLVPLGVGAETNILRSIAPGVVWVAALLAALLSLPRMFATDHEDGTLEQMLVAAEPVPVIVVASRALDRYGGAHDHLCDHFRGDVRLGARCDARHGSESPDWYAGALSRWCGRRCADAGTSCRRRPDVASRASALYSRPHFRFGSGNCRCYESLTGFSLHDRRRAFALCTRIGAFCSGCGAADCRTVNLHYSEQK